MRSIFSNKLVFNFIGLIPFLFLSLSAVPQNIIDIDKGLTSKQDTKIFIDNLFKIYGKSIMKYTDNTTNILNFYDIVTSDEIVEHHEVLINFKVTQLINFKVTQLGYKQGIIKGESTKIISINDIYYSIRENDSLKTKYEDSISIPLNNISQKQTKHYINRKWRSKNKPKKVTLEAYSQLNFSTLILTPNNFSNETNNIITNRNNNESGMLSLPYGIKVGFTNFSNGISFSYSHNPYNIRFKEPNSIDWDSGLYNNVNNNDSFSLKMESVGIHYIHANYFSKFSTYFSTALNLNWLSKNTSLNYKGFSAIGSLGVNFKPSYCFEVHLAPTINYFLTPIKASYINSNPLSVGAELGIKFNIPAFN